MTTQQNERAELIRAMHEKADAHDNFGNKNTAELMRKAAAALLQADAKVGWEVVAVHDKDQPNGIAWCPGNPEALADITALYTIPHITQQAARVPLTDEQCDRILSTQIPGGSQARAWFLPHEHPKGLANVREVVRRMVEAAHGIGKN